MAKGYILVNIPNDCSGCDCCIYWDDYNSYECGLIQMRHEGIVDKYIMEKKCPEWCPIKELPKTKYEHSGFVEEDCICFGYNLCLEDILGAEK